MGEKAPRAAGVLAGHEVRLAQATKGAEGNIFQVAYRGRDDY